MNVDKIKTLGGNLLENGSNEDKLKFLSNLKKAMSKTKQNIDVYYIVRNMSLTYFEKK